MEHYVKYLDTGKFSLALDHINNEIKSNGLNSSLASAKIFALVNMDKISRALSFIKACEKVLVNADFSYQEAYCRYRLGKYTSAMSILNEMTNSHEVLTLKAQILYRTGQYSAAALLFKELRSDSCPEMQVNFEAASALAGETLESPTTNIEVCYNQALGLIQQRSFEQATAAIDRAQALDTEKTESHSVALLEFIVMICMGHDLEAASLLKKFLLNERQLTQSQKTIASLNLALIEKSPLPKNISLSASQRRQLALFQNYLQ